MHPNSLKNLKPVPKEIQGRKPGQINKDTRTLKIAIAEFLEKNHSRLEGWLDRIEEEQGPVAAWAMFRELIEYKLPKLARTEHTGPDGGPVTVVQVSFTGVSSVENGSQRKVLEAQVMNPIENSAPEACDAHDGGGKYSSCNTSEA